MRQVRKLQEQKRSAPKAIPTGPPRRIVFGNLPEWADVSSVLQLVHGGTVERAWAENGDIIVQFVDREKCIEYYEAHSNGIKIKDDEDDVIISVAMPEDGLPDNAELWMRVEEGASRVVCLSGLPTGLKGTNDESILGIVSDPTWDGKKFDHIVIKPMEVSLQATFEFISSDFFSPRMVLISTSSSTICMMVGISFSPSRRERMTALPSLKLTRRLPADDTTG